MVEYATEEQQVEALKKWWQENGRYVIGGVVLGLAILFGWNAWKDYKETRARDASALYMQLEQAVNAADEKRAATLHGQITNDYNATPYAAAAEMTMARLAVDKGDLEGAALYLRSAIALADQQALKEVATLRLANVLTSAGKADEALALLEGDWPAAWSSLHEEYLGDALRQQGKIEEARVAYDRAIITANGPASYLRLKRDALGTITSGSGSEATP